MSLLEALVLGVVQGLTEFLPVSSSGHLVLAQSLLGVRVPGVRFEVVVHLGTLLAVVWVYRRRLAELVGGVVAREKDALSYVGLLVLATLPAVAVGFAARRPLEAAFESPLLAAGLLLLTGLLVWSVKRSAPTAERPRPSPGESISVGFAQALAILPGVSRSGATVAVGAWLGVEVIRIAEFSFLMSIPALVGAAWLQLSALGATGPGPGAAALAGGFAAACVSGVAAIRIFLWMLAARTFHRFAYYCWAVGSAYLVAAALVPELRG